jgi:ABC-type dipeptide/oligopeptide/nickel transport system permease component
MIVRGRATASDIADKLPATTELSVWAMMFSLATGAGLGYLAAIVGGDP